MQARRVDDLPRAAGPLALLLLRVARSAAAPGAREGNCTDLGRLDWGVGSCGPSGCRAAARAGGLRTPGAVSKRALDHAPHVPPPPRAKDRGCVFRGPGRWCASCPACTPAARGAPAGRGRRGAGPQPRAGAPRAAAGGAAHQAARAAHHVERELGARVDRLRRGRRAEVARLQVQGQVVLLWLGQPERQGPACAPAHAACGCCCAKRPLRLAALHNHALHRVD